MIYQYVKRYLKNNLVKPHKNYNWTELDNIEFFQHIHKRYTNEKFLKDISEVKQAFRDFFEPIGNIIFRYYQEKEEIKFKLFPYIINPKDSKHLKNIVNIILNNQKYIEYPYKNQNNQMAILGKIRRDINRETVDIKESINIKELIKYAIRVALKLNDRDIIVQLKRNYIVKIYNKSNNSDVDNNKLNGYTTEQIEQTYKEIFDNKEYEVVSFLKNTMKYILRNDLNFKHITNEYYEENALKIIHSQIVKELYNYISLEDDYIAGIASYVMGKYFKKIHELIAIDLLENIYNGNQNAENFILFFDGKTILINNKKYKIPSLKTDDLKKWNIKNMINICNSWMKIKIKKEQLEYRLMEIDDDIVKVTDDGKLKFFIDEKKQILEDIKLEELNINSKASQIKPIFKSIVEVLIDRKQLVQL